MSNILRFLNNKLKFKILIKLKNIHFRQALKASVSDKRETGIFKKNWLFDKKAALQSEIEHGFEIFKLDETTINLNIQINETKQSKRIFFIDFNFTIGNITIDFRTQALKVLLFDLLQYKKLFKGKEKIGYKESQKLFIQTLKHEIRNKGMYIDKKAVLESNKTHKAIEQST